MADILKEQKNKAYNDYVKKVTPTHSLWSNMWHAFVTVSYTHLTLPTN